jgi:predicted nucleic acid-binding protein
MHFRRESHISSLDSHTFAAVTAIITMTELLVKPYREPDGESAHECYGLLSAYPNLDWICPTLETADVAAEIRAIHRLRTPDALQAATAARANATAMLTNDPVFHRLTNLKVLVLDDFV